MAKSLLDMLQQVHQMEKASTERAFRNNKIRLTESNTYTPDEDEIEELFQRLQELLAKSGSGLQIKIINPDDDEDDDDDLEYGSGCSTMDRYGSIGRERSHC